MKFVKKAAVAAALSSVLVFSSVSDFDVIPQAAAADNSMGAAFNAKADALNMHPARAMIQKASDDMIRDLRQDKDKLNKDPDYIYALLQQDVLEHFDLHKMAQIILGRNWRTATPEQRERFTEEFSKMMVRQYATAMKLFSDETVTSLPVRAAAGDARVKVQTRISQAGGQDIAVDYALYRNSQNEWKIYDVSIEGVSVIMNYRSQYDAEIRRNGLDGLIRALEQKNNQAGSVPVKLDMQAPWP